MTFDREQTIEQAARAIADAATVPFLGPLQRRYAAATMPVIVRAVTDELRAQHQPKVVDSPYDDSERTCCCHCHPSEGYPCSTVRLCDEIDASAGVQR